MTAEVTEISTRQKSQAGKEISKRLVDLPSNFLDCRDPSTGHTWRKIENFHVVPASTERGGARSTHVARKFQCDVCATVKIERYIVVRRLGSERLERIALVMEYPEGYLLPGVPRGVKPAEIVRAEQYRRALETAVGTAAGERLHDPR